MPNDIIDLTPVTKEHRADDVKPGNYFRRTKTSDKYADRLVEGQLVLVTMINYRKVSFSILRPGSGELDNWSSNIDDFLDQHEFEPNGRAMRNAEIQEAMMDSISAAQELDIESEKLEGIVRAFRPKSQVSEISGGNQLMIGDGTEELVEELPLENREVGLVRVEAQSTMLEQATDFIGKIADRRNDVTRRQIELSEKKKRVEGLIAEQKKWMEAMTGFKDAVKKLEEAIWTLNLYLGTGEQIIALREGLAASADVPLSIRQLVLCMDEECALESESNGIDAQTISKFDAWILADPRNLRQILPEQKGIVVLKPRRYMKDYGMGKDRYENSMINKAMNEENFKTYILIRNGDSLFRVCPEWEVGDYFFPTREEFKDAFLKKKKVSEEQAEKMGIDTSDWTEHDRDWGKDVDYIVKPDDDDYEEVKDQIDKQMGYYSKALIMLQGIVDRTGIFPEYQQMGLNLMDVTQWSDHIRFIHDADPNTLLTSGRETFEQWHDRTNKQLTIGDRVIGLFSKLEKHTRRDDDSRKNPQNAGDPPDMEMFTIESLTDSGGLRFFYKRPDKKPSRYVYGKGWVEDEEYKTKAGFTVYKDDDEVLAYDVITLEEVNYFLTDRLSRPDYMTMFPLLKRVRNVKRQERLEEAPFIDLIVGEMMKEDDETGEAKLRREASDLIQWFKFKNKIHRSIKKDEAASFTQVMKEWRLRRKTDSRELSLDEDLVEKYKNDMTLLIAARTNYWTIIERSNDDSIFTTRIDLYRSRNAWKVERTKDYYIPGREWTLWTPIFKHDDWDTWMKGARSKDFLNPVELEAYLEEHRDDARSWAVEKAKGWNWSRKDHVQLRKIWDTAIVLDANREIQFHFTILFYDTKKQEFELVAYRIDHNWKRKPGEGVVRVERDYHNQGDRIENNIRNASKGPWDPRKNQQLLYWIDEAAIAEAKNKQLEMREADKLEAKKQRFAQEAFHKLVKVVNEGRLEKAKAAYLGRYGNPYLWDSSKAKSQVNSMGYDAYKKMTNTIGTLLLKSIITEDDVYDKTLNDLVNFLNTKLKAEDMVDPNWDTEFIDPVTYVLMPRPVPGEEEDDD